MPSTTTVPVGTVCAILVSAENAPANWLYCNGAAFDTGAYSELAALLPSGIVPNLCGQTIIGAGADYAANQPYGQNSVTLTLSQMPSHQHYGWGMNSAPDSYGLGFGQSTHLAYIGAGSHDGGNAIFGSTWAGGSGVNDIPVSTVDTRGETIDSVTSSFASENDPVSVMQPSVAINYFIYAGAPGRAS